MDSKHYRGGEGSVKRLEEDIIKLLGPVEPIVMRIQSLLVWEYPKRSAVMFICVHLIVWFLATTSMSAYFLISSASLILFLVDTWKNQIWPEIRVPPSVPEDTDGWTPVHPRLLNVLEISQHAAQVLHTIFSTLHECRLLRRESPKVFSTVCMISFITLMIIGHFIPGIMLSYILVINVMLLPCVVYHNLLKRAYLRMEPAFMWMDYNLKTKMSRSSKEASGVAMYSSQNATVEDDFDEFCPPSDPATTALLARAIIDSEDEEGMSAIPTPQFSAQPSAENSDNEEDFEDHFSPGLDRMPSFDDLDQTDDEFVPTDESNHSVSFIPSHFGETSESEEEEISFPDIGDIDNLSLDRTPTSEYPSIPFSALASSLVNQTISSMMENALHSIDRGDNSASSSYGRLPGTDAQLTYTRTDHGEAVDLHQEDLTIEEEDEEEEEEEEEDIVLIEGEIEKEFDFLDDLDLSGKVKK